MAAVPVLSSLLVFFGIASFHELIQEPLWFLLLPPHPSDQLFPNVSNLDKISELPDIWDGHFKPFGSERRYAALADVYVVLGATKKRPYQVLFVDAPTVSSHNDRIGARPKIAPGVRVKRMEIPSRERIASNGQTRRRKLDKVLFGN